MTRVGFWVLVLGTGFLGAFSAHLIHDWQTALAEGDGSVSWTPQMRGDVNGDGMLTVTDAVFTLNYLFKRGPAPVTLPEHRGRILETDQVICYSGTRGEVQSPCPQEGEDDYGQDNQFKSGFRHNYELFKPDPEDPLTWYTIDYATGLMWQYKHTIKVLPWRESLRAVSELEHAGYDDWRMPNINELFSLVNITERQPAITREFFGLNAQVFWSSSTWTADKSRAWTVRFSSGIVTGIDKGGQGQNAFRLNVVAVRNLD